MDIISIDFSTYNLPVDMGGFNDILFAANYPPELGCAGLTSSFDVQIHAQVTLLARQMFARSLVDGTSFKIVEMAVGTGGYDVAFPMVALDINPTDTALANEVYRKAIDVVEAPTTLGTSKAWVARFDALSFQAGVGEIALFAQILSSPYPAELVGGGVKFMFAVAHQGLNTKTSSHICTYRMFVTI